MLAIIGLIALIAMGTAAQSNLCGEWQQCAGKWYTGCTQCSPGFVCSYSNEYYSQCIRESSTTQATTQATTQTQAPSGGGGASALAQRFINGRFKVGRNWENENTNYNDYDYIAIWINTLGYGPTNTDFSPFFHGVMLNTAKRLSKVPVFYAYVIAFEARNRQDLQDCDVRSWGNLCTDGANFIRNNRALLVGRYTHYASNIAQYIGRDALCVFLMETDFWYIVLLCGLGVYKFSFFILFYFYCHQAILW
jgi:hypothetical protein